MFSLSRKIEEIRQKPEHIRMRYVWFWISVCMIFICTIWIFSVKENFSAVDFDEGNFPDLRSATPEIQDGLPPFEDMDGSGQKSISELEQEIQKK